MVNEKGDFEVALLLCDWAESINGKLYVMGGGWTNIVMSMPITMALAANITVPWHSTNQKHKIHATLLTEDGNQVSIQGRDVQIEAELEVGRPPGARLGRSFSVPLALRLQAVPLGPGVYVWRFEISGQEYGRVIFEAAAAPGYQPPQDPKPPMDEGNA